MRYCIIILINITIIIYSCQNSKPLSPETEPELAVYYNAFVEEATKRGVDIGKFPKEITLNFGKTYNAWARTYPSNKTISVDRDQWKKLSTLDQEFVIFHELGHLILNRSHDIFTLPNGEFKSMMLTYENSSNIESTHLYLGMRRKYYIDQLFNPNVAIPDWATLEYNPFPIANANRRLIAHQDFNYSATLQSYFDNLNTAQYSLSTNSLLNVKNPKDFGFYIDALQLMKMVEIPSAEIERMTTSTNYEVEFRYRLNKGTIRYSYNHNGKSSLTITHKQDGQAMNLTSAIFLFKFSNFQLSDNEGFNIVRLVRQNDIFSIYHNNKHLFTSDLWSAELPNKLGFSIASDDARSNIDIDYFKIYERL